MITIQQRSHRTGRIAEVGLQDDGRFYARILPAESEGGKSVGRTDNIPTLERAQAVADTLAHADCAGYRCGRWELMPAVKADPRLLHSLYPHAIDGAGRLHTLARCPNGHLLDANFEPAEWLAGLSAGTLAFYCIDCGVSSPPKRAERDAVLDTLLACGF